MGRFVRKKAITWIGMLGGAMLVVSRGALAPEAAGSELPTVAPAFMFSGALLEVDQNNRDYSAELPRIPPKSPAESLKAFRIHPGFRIELAAAEPVLASPVALDFDEDGRIFVIEFPEFNQNSSKTPQGHGRVRLLEDTDGNGTYDKGTIFLADLDSPTAVCCYDGGVFVGAVPNILYAKDTDGDGTADIRRIVFTGFARDVGGEAMLNSFRWLFDNRIHVSTSLSGGQVRHAIRDQGVEAVLLNILDPNREVKPQFHTYVVVTDAGRMLTGMITAESANSLAIRRADGTTETVLRIHIDELRSTGLSFMPEGLEKQIDVPTMADLLAYLTSAK